MMRLRTGAVVPSKSLRAAFVPATRQKVPVLLRQDANWKDS